MKRNFTPALPNERRYPPSTISPPSTRYERLSVRGTATLAVKKTNHTAQATAPTPIPATDSLNRRTRWRSVSRAITMSSPPSRSSGVMGAIAERTKSATRSIVAVTLPLSRFRSIGALPFLKKAGQISVACDPVCHLDDRLGMRALDRRQ